ncbi:hypothetical protein PGB90_008935 [Kerria lacca]
MQNTNFTNVDDQVPDPVNIRTKINSEKWIRKRFIVVFLIYLGNLFAILFQGNLNIAIVNMTSTKSGIDSKPEFDWQPHKIGFILSSFNYGYLLCSFGGLLSKKFGGVVTYGSSITIMALLNVISPFALRRSVTIFMVFRGLEGFCAGVAYSSSYDVWICWVPINKTMKLFFFNLLGYSTGAMITYPTCGFLIYKLSWPSAFYIPGCTGLVWSIIWFIFMLNNSTTDETNLKSKKISTQCNRNRLFLIFKVQLPTNIPLLKIISSKVVLAAAFAKFAYGFGYLGIRNILPLFVNGIVAGITEFCCGCGEMLAPIFVGFVIQHHRYSEWSIFFVSCGGTFLMAAIIFLLYGSSEVQLWAQDLSNENEIPGETKL